ncbi:MAG: MFS transporter [Candidatus Jordarchaeum sp.]|uniref:MFS transporter n=1 Tax=Candidatus Jordarchaeum sp. TaxID=2823881 RepID=UPI00404AB8A6
MAKKKEEKIEGKKGTMASLGLAFFVNNAETQALPTYFTSIGREFAVARTALGFITTARSIVQTITLPIWGYLSDRYSRKKVLLAGILIWAFTTFLVAMSGNYEQLIFFRLLTGLGLAAIVPTAFSIIVDIYKPEVRGRYFGVFWLLGMLGIVVVVPILGALDAQSITGGIESNLTQLLFLQYIPGFLNLLNNALVVDYFLKQTLYLGAWRTGFWMLGAVCLVIAGVVWVFLKEPVRGGAEKELMDVITKENVEKFKIDRKSVGGILRIPTMWVIIAQGLTGYFPWIVYQVWLIHWLESVRYLTPGQATLVFAMIVLGSAISSVIGGFLGDKAELRFPRRGRIIIAQISVFIGIPLSWVILFVLQEFTLFLIVAFITAVLINWPGSAAVYPIVAAVNKPEVRSTAWSFEQTFEQGLSAFAAILVGFFADNINAGIAGFSMSWVSPYIGFWLIFGTPVLYLILVLFVSGQSLTYSMAVFVIIPWTLSFLFWFLGYRYYPRDKTKVVELLEQRRKELVKK